MRTLVLCDDSAHPGALTRAGLLGLGDCGLRFDWLEDPDRWSAERMAEYPLVIFSKANNRSQTDSAPWATETEGRALADHVARGNGLLVLHSGSALYDDSPSLRRLMGGVFAGHPPQCPVTVQPQPGHPLTRGSSAFTLRDEHYRMAMNDPQVDLFLRTASEHGTQPAGWTRRHGAGRVCMLTPGHNPEVWQHPAYQCILRNCLAWCGPDAGQGAAE